MILIDKLRAATKPMHEELDKAMVPYIKSIRTVDEYMKLLIAFYGFFQPVYKNIDDCIDIKYLQDYSRRRKPDDILQNLEALEYRDTIDNFCEKLPHITEHAEAFGALYVLEGSTLGGLMIKKMIADELHLPDEKLSFFAGYGKETRERWNTFVEALNKATNNTNEEQKLIETASQTFIAFRNWLQLSYL